MTLRKPLKEMVLKPFKKLLILFAFFALFAPLRYAFSLPAFNPGIVTQAKNQRKSADLVP
jgi:hypothetical protein